MHESNIIAVKIARHERVAMLREAGWSVKFGLWTLALVFECPINFSLSMRPLTNRRLLKRGLDKLKFIGHSKTKDQRPRTKIVKIMYATVRSQLRTVVLENK